MAQTDRHEEISNRILALLRAESFPPLRATDVRYEDPISMAPSIGIVVSPMEESEGVGTNLQDDIRYTFRVTRVIGRMKSSEGLNAKSYFRTRLRQIFHRKRIGGIECELVTIVRHADFTSMPKWRDKNLDVTSMLITVTVRETRVSE
jgi:hypothetical protein